MDILISFVLAVSLLAISPGPDNIFVLMQSVVHGKKYGISTIIGLMSGCLVHKHLWHLVFLPLLRKTTLFF